MPTSSTFRSFFFVIWFLHLFRFVDAKGSSRTIEDTLGDLSTGQKVIYEPTDAWESVQYPFASGGTFMRGQSTGNISATLTFNGTAIFVYFIIPSEAFPHDIPFATSFSLDDNPPVQFQPSPTDTPPSDSDELVFSMTNLTATQHTLVISASASENVTHIIDFDYATYQHPHDHNHSSPTDSTPDQSSVIPQASSTAGPDADKAAQKSATPSKVSSSMIAGIIVVVVLTMAFMTLIVCLLRRRDRKQRQRTPSIEIDPSDDVEARGATQASWETFEGTGEGSANPFDDSHAPETTSTPPAHTGVMAQLPKPIYSNGITRSGVPIPSLPYLGFPGVYAPAQTAKRTRGVPLHPLRIVNRASSTIPSATTARGEPSRREQELEERLGAYLLLMQQKADERLAGSPNETEDTTPTAQEDDRSHFGYSLEKQEKGNDLDEKANVKAIDALAERMSDPNVSVEELKQMIVSMRQQIEALQARRDQTQSPFEDPPPLYSPGAFKRKTMTNASAVSKDSPTSPTVVDRWRAAVARFSRIAPRRSVAVARPFP